MRSYNCADGSSLFVSSNLAGAISLGADCLNPFSISSGVALNSFTARPIPRASSGSFLAPNRSNTIRRITIMSGPIKFMILAIVVGIKKSRYVCFVKKLCSVQSIHTELAKLYSQNVIYCLASLAALFDIGHAPKDQSNRSIHLPCYAAAEIHPVMALHALQ